MNVDPCIRHVNMMCAQLIPCFEWRSSGWLSVDQILKECGDSKNDPCISVILNIFTTWVVRRQEKYSLTTPTVEVQFYSNRWRQKCFLGQSETKQNLIWRLLV